MSFNQPTFFRCTFSLCICLTVLLFCLSVVKAEAGEWCEESSSDCAEVGEWKVAIGVGAGVRTNPVADSDDIPLIILPSVSYYGKRFYFENLNLGYQLVESKRYDFSLTLSPGRDHLFFNEWSLGNFSVNGTEVTSVEASSDEIPLSATVGQEDIVQPSSDGRSYEYTASLRDRKLSVLAGVDLHYYINSFSLGLQVLHDVRGIHDGAEVRAALRHEKSIGKTTFSSAFGLIWQDSNTLDYYYGIDEDEVESSALAYQVDSGFSPFGRLDIVYQVNDHWSLKATGYYRALADSVADSPIVDESGYTSVFIGGVYHF